MSKPDVHLFHIAYSDETVNNRPAGFELMDNRRNERPDWYEYWPIRSFLQNSVLDEQAYYGFFSPKFKAKTNLGAAQVRAFVESNWKADIDAFLFSPQPDVGVFFENVFVGGELFNPGFLNICQSVLTESGWLGDLSNVVMDSRTTVFSNYLVARPAYWRKWLQICECVFLLSENPLLRPPLHQQLNMTTGYGDGVAQRKIFVIEGIASLILTVGGHPSCAISPFVVPWFSIFSRYRAEAIAADALKMAFIETRQIEYLVQFRALKERVMREAVGAARVASPISA